MKREDLMNGISEIDADLVEKFIETDRKLQNARKSPNPNRLWLKISGIAACAVLIAAIPMGLMLSERKVTIDSDRGSIIGSSYSETDPDALTYEEIMRLPTLSVGGLFDREYYKSLKDYVRIIKEVCETKLSFVCGDVLEVRHYIEWDGEHVRGFTVSTVRIAGADPSYNELGSREGDIVQIRENYWVRYADPDRELTYFAEKSGYGDTVQTWEQLDPGIQELTLVRGEKYVKYFRSCELLELPMGVGNRYTFCLLETNDDDSNLYRAECIYCVGMTDDDWFISEFFNIRIDEDIRMVAEKIYKRFRFK